MDIERFKMLDTPIPIREVPEKNGFEYSDVEDCGESLVSLQDLGIICEPYSCLHQCEGR